MTKSERLKPVVRVAESKERDAAKALGDCQRALSEREASLSELLSYRDEYRRRFQQAGCEGLNGSSLQDYQSFLNRLDGAILQQREITEAARRAYEQQKRVWHEKWNRTKVLDKVVDRYRKQEAHLETRREQSEHDERAQHIRSEPED